MDHFTYRHQALFAEEVAVSEIVQTYGSPCYIYAKATFERHWQAFDQAFQGHPHLVCYAVKANANIAILNILAKLGSGFDIVSQGELERVLAAGGDPAKIVFSGIAKTPAEIQRALHVGIHCFNVESVAELTRIHDIAAACGCIAPISLRVNPDVDAQTHPYISTGLKENKFGIDVETAREAYRQAAQMPHLNIIGIDCHIGSQLTATQPFLDALDRMLHLLTQLKTDGIEINHIDIGGGLGIRYHDETPSEPAEYAQAVMQKLAPTGYTVLMEPGRAIAGNAGIFVTTVEFLKTTQDKHFAIVDGAMNDLLRPALYDAWQDIIPVHQRPDTPSALYDVVGPICETGDFLGKQRTLAIQPGDLLAVRSSGAYGFSMSSNYNSRPRVAEVMVDGTQAHLIRARETHAQLFANEHLLP